MGHKDNKGYGEEQRLRASEDSVLRRIFGPMREEVTEYWRKCMMRSFIICILQQTLLG
jgi:hypothetical protein